MGPNAAQATQYHNIGTPPRSNQSMSSISSMGSPASSRHSMADTLVMGSPPSSNHSMTPSEAPPLPPPALPPSFHFTPRNRQRARPYDKESDARAQAAQITAEEEAIIQENLRNQQRMHEQERMRQQIGQQSTADSQAARLAREQARNSAASEPDPASERRNEYKG
jgi:hypothetical protein